ncbi:hypothetical protein [Desulfomonile tiedjei]|uniref:Uncharacterized protein n=1 Tax=Desulfomonile tiedjei (strain ATCC 49306 / DSM 6799 / DCB-1) TaxID=706587 RepID=I4CDC0_DESTA|nr:hypothetical protein [Desulfomonile tiedjei]AFM27561.1 hypothetical protein Desti_4947 [Desulfomonile tiedjei DSM 6799]
MNIRMKGNSRGLRDIRTHSGKVDRVGLPYMAYMSISCLEMEKARREKERLSALTRIKNIEQRIREIEAEKDLLLKGVGERTRTDLQKASTPRDQSAQCKGGFKIRY